MDLFLKIEKKNDIYELLIKVQEFGCIVKNEANSSINDDKILKHRPYYFLISINDDKAKHFEESIKGFTKTIREESLIETLKASY